MFIKSSFSFVCNVRAFQFYIEGNERFQQGINTGLHFRDTMKAIQRVAEKGTDYSETVGPGMAWSPGASDVLPHPITAGRPTAQCDFGQGTSL